MVSRGEGPLEQCFRAPEASAAAIEHCGQELTRRAGFLQQRPNPFIVQGAWTPGFPAHSQMSCTAVMRFAGSVPKGC